MTNSDPNNNFSHTLSVTDDGTIQITFSFPFLVITEAQDKVLLEEAKNVEVAGFRKGTAPIDKVKEKIPAENLIQHTLSHLLPNALTHVLTQEKLEIAIYPKFELISANPNEDWQIRAVTCKLPVVEVGDYKKAIELSVKESKSKKSEKDVKELSVDEKQNIVLDTLIKTATLSIPKLIVEDDVNARLSNLLERVERLGLNLENYLSSIGKTPQGLREEYEKQSQDSIAIELILNKIADNEKVEITDKMLTDAISASKSDPILSKELEKPEKQKVLSSILRRQETLKKLIASV